MSLSESLKKFDKFVASLDEVDGTSYPEDLDVILEFYGLTVQDLKVIRENVKYSEMQSVSDEVKPVGESGKDRVRRLAGENE